MWRNAKLVIPKYPIYILNASAPNKKKNLRRIPAVGAQGQIPKKGFGKYARSALNTYLFLLLRQFVACPHVHNAHCCDIRPKKLMRRHSRKQISGRKWIFKDPSLL